MRDKRRALGRSLAQALGTLASTSQDSVDRLLGVLGIAVALGSYVCGRPTREGSGHVSRFEARCASLG
jgi:hypothetical protein